MKVILIKKIPHLGESGDVKEVAEGYARNYLIPQKLAIIATKSSLEKIVERKNEENKKTTEKNKRLRELSAEFNGKTFTLSAKGKKGTLFGSVGPKEIATEIGKHGFAVEEKMIDLKEHIKKTGSYEIIIKFSPEIRSTAYLTVEEK